MGIKMNTKVMKKNKSNEATKPKRKIKEDENKTI